MDKKSKILLGVVLLALIGSVLATYYRYFVKKDFYIEAETECDPMTEYCFVYVCNPESEEDCSQDEAERVSYYKLIRKKASSISLCDPADDACDALDCSNSENCQELLCDPENPGEGVVCNLPDEYNALHSEEDLGEEESEEVVLESELEADLEEQKIDSVEEPEDTAESGPVTEMDNAPQEMPL